MRILAFSALALGFGLVGFQLSACSNSADDCNATASCVSTAGSSATAGSAGKSSGAGSGNDAGASAGGTPSNGGSNTSGTSGVGGEGGSGSTGCRGDVADDAACWTTNEFGVFVSSETGDDAAGDGTQQAPFKTITKGVTSAGGKNVYVCAGADDYAEKVTLSAATITDGLRVYGGFECTAWTYATTRRVQVVSPSNIALRIDGLKKGAYIENVRFQAADGAGLDASSYGAFVTNSAKVTLKRVELKAGAGKAGAKGDDGTKGADGSVSGVPPIGSHAICSPFPPQLPTIAGGKWNAETVCGSEGGPGGTGAKNTSNGASGGAGSPTEHVNPLSNIENGGAGETNAKLLDGKSGTGGDPGAVAGAAAAAGVLSLAGYAPADGNAGADGYAGQGGGGGGASKGNGNCFGASGGAGGMGGCGGTSGKGGGGGGASVGLLSWQSEITLEVSQVTSGVGGAGGPGGKGGASGIGALGGAGGNPVSDGTNTILRAGQGGPGGNGGLGGSGSGGSGGLSVAIVYAGTKPNYDLATTTLAAAAGGSPGAGGQTGLKAPDGAVGTSAPEFEVK